MKLDVKFSEGNAELSVHLDNVQLFPGGSSEPGKDGVSPIVKLDETAEGVNITISDAEGVKTATVKHGKDGKDGINPTVTVMDISGGHRVTITDENGEKSFDVMDGKDGNGITIDKNLTRAGAAADAKATGDRLTALNEEIAKLPTGGGAAIIDVTVLPETDIRADVFYRVLSAEYWYNGTPATIYTCHVVETLPAVGEPATDATMSAIVSYYAADTGENSGYLTAELGAAFGGLPAGWYPAAALFQAAGVAYGGIVGGLDEMSGADTLYLYLKESLKYRNDDAWDNVQSIGWRGTGNAAEVFNTPLNVASGDHSHAEGYNTTASGDHSHAEGYNTTASGDHSHAEGHNTTASGDYSHAEGVDTVASGYYSHAEGSNTVARGKMQHVQGLLNIEDTLNKYAHIVGNGSINGLSNAHTLDWDGNAWFAGGIELTSPNGTRYRFNVSDDGTLIATVVTE